MTSMQSDFLDSHSRHWQDAEFLLGDMRWGGADHLYGFSAECGLKKLMMIFGMPFDAIKDMPSKSDDSKHIDKIWLRYESYRAGHPAGTRYGLATLNPFDDWSASQRYSVSSAFDAARVANHQAAANQVRLLIKQAEKDGLL
jgi:hypothetical protein